MLRSACVRSRCAGLRGRGELVLVLEVKVEHGHDVQDVALLFDVLVSELAEEEGKVAELLVDEALAQMPLVDVLGVDVLLVFGLPVEVALVADVLVEDVEVKLALMLEVEVEDANPSQSFEDRKRSHVWTSKKERKASGTYKTMECEKREPQKENRQDKFVQLEIVRRTALQKLTKSAYTSALEGHFLHEQVALNVGLEGRRQAVNPSGHVAK